MERAAARSSADPSAVRRQPAPGTEPRCPPATASPPSSRPSWRPSLYAPRRVPRRSSENSTPRTRPQVWKSRKTRRTAAGAGCVFLSGSVIDAPTSDPSLRSAGHPLAPCRNVLRQRTEERSEQKLVRVRDCAISGVEQHQVIRPHVDAELYDRRLLSPRRMPRVSSTQALAQLPGSRQGRSHRRAATNGDPHPRRGSCAELVAADCNPQRP